VLVPLLLALLAVLGGGAWYAVQGQDSGPQAGGGVSTHAPPPPPSHTPSAHATSQATTTTAPTVTHEQPSNAPTRKPNVTLKSDLAFGFNSATLSSAAKTAIQHVAQQVRTNGLTGKIYVDGYTDNLGSAAYGLVLSRRRADAVSVYLGSQLVGVPGISIVSIGHGEADPIADNSTAAGRQANRRVTITLPRP
jgi:outer membrane protein OmpA-like peptidoglycan-associated protein